MTIRSRVAAKSPAKAHAQVARREAHGARKDADSLDDLAAVTYLQGAVGNQAVNRLIQRSGDRPGAWLAASRHPMAPPRDLLSGPFPAHQEPARVQRAPATVATQSPTGERSDYVDLLNGFDELAVAAIQKGGKTLDRVHFGRDLSPSHHSLLEHVRKVFIEAQDQSAEARRSAISDWPALEAQLRTALTRAKQLRIPESQVDQIGDMISAIGEQYVHARPRRGQSLADQGQDYADLMTGIQHLLVAVEQEDVDKRDAVVASNIDDTDSKQRAAITAVQFGGHLSPEHRHLLESLRNTFLLARTQGLSKQALAEWQSLQGDLRRAFKRAQALVNEDVGEIQKDLSRVGEQLIHGGVYSEVHNQALKEINLKTPDLAFQVEAFKEAAHELSEAQKFAQKGLEMTEQDAISVVLSQKEYKTLGTAIFEAVKSPGEIAEKFEKWKEQDLISKGVTLIDVANTVKSMAKAIAELTFETLKRFGEGAMEVALKAGAGELAERWKTFAEWAEGKLKWIEKLGHVATVIGLVVSAIKVVDLIRQGKWAEAAREIGETAAGLAAGAAVGAGGTAMVGGTAIVIAAEIEAIHGAAAMIRYCRKANIREAALTFVDVCADAASIEGRDLVADVKLLADGAAASEKATIEKRLEGNFPYWLRHLEDLSNQVSNTRPSRIGGQPDLRKALGPEALQVLEHPGAGLGSWEAMAEQIRAVLAGANEMAKYVTEAYPKIDPKEEAEGEGKGEHKEELPATGAGAGSRAGAE